MQFSQSRNGHSATLTDLAGVIQEDSTNLQPVVNGWQAVSIQAPSAELAASIQPAGAPAEVENAVSLTGPAASLHVATAQHAFGVTGAGIRIGIMSDSFNVHGGYALDVANGALDAGITVLKEGPASGNEEGRAMAEVIHQIAPDAQILFYTAFDGEADFANGIAALAAAGAQIIVDDVTYLDEPFFQDSGLVQRAAEQAVAHGVSYFTAAGNEGDNYYQHAFQGIQTALPDRRDNFLAMNFGTAADPQMLQSLTIASGSSVNLDLQWDQPFGGSANSLGMALYDDSGDLVGYAMHIAVGGNPDQVLQFTNSTASTSFHLAIVADGGASAPGQFKYIAYGHGLTINDPTAGIGSGSIFGHEVATGVNTVGAADWNQAPNDTQVESFSSVGTGSLLFDTSGNRLAQPQTAGQVSFLAPDGGNTDTFGTFHGTSAAAPAAAATAALLLQANATLTPAQVSDILKQSAVPASGSVGSIGAGLIQADTAVALASAMGSQQGVAGATLFSRAATLALPTLSGSTGTTTVASVASHASFITTLAHLGQDPTAQADQTVASIQSIAITGGSRQPEATAFGAAPSLLHSSFDLPVLPLNMRDFIG